MKKYDFENKSWEEKDLRKLIKKISAQSRIKITCDLIKGKSNKILDVGCGIGYLSEFLQGKYSMYTGTDLLSKNINIAKELYGDKKNVLFTTDNMFSKNPGVLKKKDYDYILMLELIEHVDNPGEYVRKAGEYLKKGGHLLISTPHALGITNYLWNLKHRNRILSSYELDGTQTDHVVTWDKQVIQNLLIKNGFKVIAVKLSRNTFTKGQSIIIKGQKV